MFSMNASTSTTLGVLAFENNSNTNFADTNNTNTVGMVHTHDTKSIQEQWNGWIAYFKWWSVRMFNIRTLFPNVCVCETKNKKKETKQKTYNAIECEDKAEWPKKKFSFRYFTYAIFVYRELFAWTFFDISSI